MKLIRTILVGLSFGLIVAGLIVLMWTVTKIVSFIILAVLICTALSFVKW